ncbi:MAG: GWxTD domain-containing protein, partial [Bacteroidetes bacterium]
GYTAPTSSDKEFVADISFRPSGENRTYLRRESILRSSSSAIFFQDFRLPEGEYEVDVDIFDRTLNTHSTLVLPGVYRVKALRPVRTSDILLSREKSAQGALSRPIITPSLTRDDNTLHYYMDIQAPGFEVLTVRAILYKEKEADRQVRETTSAYLSLYQSNRVLYPARQPTFHDSLFLSKLEEGEYMIQVLVYEDDELLTEEKTWFEVGGDIRKRIFEDIDKSIRMMEYISPAAKLEALLQQPDPQVKKTEFLKTWENLYRFDPEANMEAYYRRVYTADTRYREGNTPGWQTARGKIYIQYGEPREKALSIDGGDYLRWTYVRWDLSFLFRERNQHYELVE